MSEETTEVPKPKLAIDHGKPHPAADTLIRTLLSQVSNNPTDPSKVLQWLGSADIADVRIACLRGMTGPWSVATQPLIESLSDDQARGMLCAIVVGFWQGMSKAK